MKKLIVIKLVLIIVLIIACGFLYVMYFNTKNNNALLKLEIESVKVNTKKANNNIEMSKINIEKLKEEKKDSIWELDSWKLMKEKIERAL